MDGSEVGPHVLFRFVVLCMRPVLDVLTCVEAQDAGGSLIRKPIAIPRTIMWEGPCREVYFERAQRRPRVATKKQPRVDRKVSVS